MKIKYRLADRENHILGLFGTPQEAMEAAPATTDWLPVTDRGFGGDHDGWRLGGWLHRRVLNFTIRLVGDQESTDGRAL